MNAELAGQMLENSRVVLMLSGALRRSTRA
jgi:hypothetical protein